MRNKAKTSGVNVNLSNCLFLIARAYFPAVFLEGWLRHGAIDEASNHDLDPSRGRFDLVAASGCHCMLLGRIRWIGMISGSEEGVYLPQAKEIGKLKTLCPKGRRHDRH
jgi:hypothetical protein